MDRLDALKLFIRIVESGSFAAAAREMGVGQPAVSKQIASLERHLGAQLVRRTSRSMTLTETGQSVYEAGLRIIGDFTELESSVGRGQLSPAGMVRVTVAPVFGRLYVVPHLPAFFASFPNVSVDLSATERNVNLVEDGFDLSIKSGRLADSSMIAKHLVSSPVVVVATPAYLEKHGRPERPQDLARHACVVFAPLREPRAWRLENVDGAGVHVPSGNFHTGDAEQIRAAVLAHMGLVQAPAWLFAPEIASGAVISVLQDFAPAPMPIHAVHPSGRRLPTKTRVFIDFVAEILTADSGPAFVAVRT
ncbi:LysR family transcriptional regulator [Paraburkholderia sp. UYCP14C]|uniref:LysR family transcriptional regulator n=1 Tax=Paraburkholderia sp. UYCP14C TaxID=2511130 RepID=UPI00101EE777|nr:LysR family transcriptional regulator [Paraburkholderia sp. UYCP14C]RZF28499.1 LysR family transcriptional regulator [Paraburkholderia sp. UYCP14C]